LTSHQDFAFGAINPPSSKFGTSLSSRLHYFQQPWGTDGGGESPSSAFLPRASASSLVSPTLLAEVSVRSYAIC
jgi:hypothetical protein